MPPPRLPVEIFQLIFEHIRHHQSDLLPLLTICRSLHSDVERLLYRTIILSDDTCDSHRVFFSRVTSCPSLALRVHSLTLWIGTKGTKNDEFPYTQLAQALELMDNLKIFIIKSHFDSLYNPIRLGQTLDYTDFKFSLEVLLLRTKCVFWDSSSSGVSHGYPSLFYDPNQNRVNTRTGNFIKQQTGIQELEWKYPNEISSSPGVVPRLRILQTSWSCVDTFFKGRSITHLRLVFDNGSGYHSPRIFLPMFTLEVLSIDRPFKHLGPTLSTAFPNLRVLEGQAVQYDPFQQYLSKHLEQLTKLTRLKITWSIHISIINLLLEKLFACNSNLMMIEVQLDKKDVEVICCTRGMLVENGLRETRMFDDWKRA